MFYVEKDSIKINQKSELLILGVLLFLIEMNIQKVRTFMIEMFNVLGFMGSELYAAPEIFCHLPFSFPADMWAIGVLAYLLLAGEPPFRPEDGSVACQVAACNVKFPPDIWYVQSLFSVSFSIWRPVHVTFAVHLVTCLPRNTLSDLVSFMEL